MGPRSSSLVGGGGWGLRGVLWVLAVVLVVSVLLLQSADAKRKKDGDRDNWRIAPKHMWAKRHRKASECRLGGKRYALEDTWSPDLGPPFGVWYCVRCHCQKVVRKSRIVGKVKCENIKSTCPQVSCRDPVLLPGACCKVCPAPDTPSPMSQEEPVDELPNGNHFAVLLNGRTSQSPLTTSLVATGRLAYRRKTLHFSFLLPEGTPSPASVQFLHENGDILEELEAQPTPYEATNNRMCGTWTKVPRDYRALLRDEKLWVALVPTSNSTEDTVSGLVSRYSGVDSEVFSALLIPAKPTSQPLLKGGGTAIISVSAPTDSLHISLVFNGVFLPEDTHNITLVIELIPSRAVEPVVETVRLNKVFTDVNRVEVMTTLGDEGLRLLARGRVEMRVWSTTAEDLVLEGIITPRATCNVFSAVLTPPIAPTSSSATSSDTSYVVTKDGELMTNQLEKKVIIGENAEDDRGAYGVDGKYDAGWAVMTLSNDGAFDYQVFIKGLTGQVAKLTLERVVRRKKSRMVEDITSTFEDGWANGTYDKPTYRDMEALLQGQLQVRVETNEIGEKLKGSLVPVAVTEALRSTWPILLSSPASPLAATAWVAVDAACVLHYDVIVSGDMPDGARDPSWALRLREEDNKWDPRFAQNNIKLEEAVTGRDISSHMAELSRISLSRLNAGVTHLDLVLLPSEQTWNDTMTASALPTLSGLVKGVQVPAICVQPSHPGGSYSNPVTCDSLPCLLDSGSDIDTPTYRCIDDDKKVYEDGQSWTNPLDICSRCMCTKGRIHCDPVICPSLPSTCLHSVTLPGECCPSCDVGNHVTPEGDVKGCNLSNTFHAAGTQWHPYLPPNGFDKCVVCICNATTLETTCSRKECPPLPCPQKAAYYPAKTSCCKKCPPPPIASISTGLFLPSDPGMTEEERKEWRLRHGGCVRSNKIYDNGQEWHPRVFPAGVFKCVTCLCKDSKITCRRNTCPKLSCHTKEAVADECCPRCADNYTTRQTGPTRKNNRKGNNRKSKKGYYKKNSSEITTSLGDHNYRYSKSGHRSGYSSSRWMGKPGERTRIRRGE